MELNLIVFNDNNVSSLGTPLNIFVTLKCVRYQARITNRLVGVVELDVDFLAKLIQEMFVLSVQERVSQIHQRVASSGLLN